MAIKGYMYITSRGYDPELGRSLNDPYLGSTPTLGGCMPNIRRQVLTGDHIFVVSGSVTGAQQLVMGGFEVAEKLDPVVEAFHRFPNLHLRRGQDGQIQGNIIVTEDGKQHPLDNHDPESFGRRIENYVVGRNPIVLTTGAEIELGRMETLPILRTVLGKDGLRPIDVMGRCKKLEQDQVLSIRDWLEDLKIRADLGRTDDH